MLIISSVGTSVFSGMINVSKSWNDICPASQEAIPPIFYGMLTNNFKNGSNVIWDTLWISGCNITITWNGVYYEDQKGKPSVIYSTYVFFTNTLDSSSFWKSSFSGKETYRLFSLPSEDPLEKKKMEEAKEKSRFWRQ